MATGGKHFKPAGTGSAPGSDSPMRHMSSQRPTPAQSVRPVAAPARGHAATEGRPATGAVGRIPYGGAPQSSPYARSGHHAPQGTGEPPRRKGRNVASCVLIALGVVLLLAAGGLFIHAQLGYRQAASFYDDLNKEAISDTASDGIPNIDFDALKKVNEDVVGWIYIPGTNINHVVAQGDTNDTYLRTLINGEYNANGTVFLDMDDTAPGVVDQQTTLYGHHMNDGSMFSYINETLQQETFDTIDKVYYITPGATYEFKPMFTMKVADDYVDARQTNFDDEGGLTQYLSDSLAHAGAQSKDAQQQVEDAEQVLTLVTCDDAFLAQTKRAAMVCTLVGTVGE